MREAVRRVRSGGEKRRCAGNDRSERKEQNERRACAKRGVRGEQRDGDDGRRGAEAAKAGSGTAPPSTGYGSWEWSGYFILLPWPRHLRCGGAQYRGERGARKSVGGPGNAQAKGLRCQGRVPSVEGGGDGQGGGSQRERPLIFDLRTLWLKKMGSMGDVFEETLFLKGRD